MLTVEELTTEQKLGMLLCARRCWDEKDFAYTLSLIRNRSLGCVQVPLDANTSHYIEAIREAADYPILIFADMEGGYPNGEMPSVPAQTLAACLDDSYLHAYAKGIAVQAKRAGFSGTWCPVVDLSRSMSSHRRFGDDPYLVAHAAEQVLRVFEEYAFIGTAKHFPGGGGDVDTHMTEGCSYVTEQQLEQEDMIPYLQLMEKGLLPAVMTRHVTLPNIDPDRPATLSKKVLGMLRKRGFDGVMFSDSLAMMGILQKYGEEKVLGLCVDAGCDILLVNYRTPTERSFSYLKKDYEEGAFDEARLNEAVRRVLTLQAYAARPSRQSLVLTEGDRQKLIRATRDCITVEGKMPSIDGDALFAVMMPQTGKGVGEELATQQWYDPNRVISAIRREFPSCETVTFPEFPDAEDNERVLLAATGHRQVVFVTYCSYTCYQGADGLTRRAEALIDALTLSKKTAVVVHFGNPLALKPLKPVPKLYGYTAPDSLEAAIEVVSGRCAARGRLPIRL